MSFWNTIIKKVDPKTLVSGVTIPKQGMEFRVGEGMTPEQTNTAYETIAKSSQKNIPNSFWDNVKTEFSVREEPVEVRRIFEAEPVLTKAPPVVTQLGTLGFSLFEAIPRAAATIYGELFAPDNKTGKVNLGINAKRLGYEESTYPTAAQEVTDAINNGEDPILAGLRIFSNKTLDVAFGAQLTTQILKTVEKQLLKGGVESRMSAWEALGKPSTIEEAEANKIVQRNQAFRATKDLPLAEREKVLAEVTNASNKSFKVLRDKGIPSIKDTAKLKVARVAEVASRETPIKKSFWSDILKPDINIKTTPLASRAIAGSLPGTRDVPGQAPAMGLSTRKVENVGYGGEKSSASISSLESYKTFIEKLHTGQVTVPEYKQAYENFKKNTLVIQNELEQMTKTELAKKYGGMFSRPSDTKQNLVKTALDNLKMGFTASRGLEYNPMDQGGSSGALDRLVENTDETHLASHAERVTNARAERKQRMEGTIKALNDPQTYEDYQKFIEFKGKDKLSPEQQVKYDELVSLPITKSSELKVGDEVKIVDKKTGEVRVGIVKKLRPPQMGRMATSDGVKEQMTPDGIIASLDKPYMFGAMSSFDNNIITRHTLTDSERTAVEKEIDALKDAQDHMMLRGKYAEQKDSAFELFVNEENWKPTFSLYKGRPVANVVYNFLDKKLKKEYDTIRDKVIGTTKTDAENKLNELMAFEKRNKEAFLKAKRAIDGMEISEEIIKPQKTDSLFGGETRSSIDKEILKPKSQKELIAESIQDKAKSIQEIAKETKILEPNIRRILGVGAKEGTFERVDKGVYIISKDGIDRAFIHTGDAIEVLPKLASDGLKADVVFLDIPYDTPAVKGGNRGANYNLISVDQFSKALDSIKIIARDENTPIIHMYSQAKSGLIAMTKYNDLFIEKGFKPIAKGEYQKTYKDGSPVGFPTMKGFTITEPEGILVFNQSGKDIGIENINFKLVRPKGYQTEKPAEMLESLIKMTTNEGEVVLDPFAGSGVTGAEAIKAGRRAVLIEKDKRVVDEIIRPRVNEAVNQYIDVPGIGKVPLIGEIDSTTGGITYKDDIKYVAENFDDVTDGLGDVFVDALPENPTAKEIVKVGDEIAQTIKETNKQLSEVDKLIAKGDMRVVSRDGRDVYQIKHTKRDKTTEWVNVRGEDSAVKQLTEKPKPAKPKQYKPEDQRRIDQNGFQLAFIREKLKDHPGKRLIKTIDKKEGEFLDFKNPNLAKNDIEREKIIAKNLKITRIAESALEDTPFSDRHDDPDTIREVIEDYRVSRQIERGLLDEKKELFETLKPLSNVLKTPPPEPSPIDTTEAEGRSIEIQANQALEILEDEPFGVNASLPKIIEKTVTPVNSKVHVIDTYLTTPNAVMEKIGFGKEAKMLRDGMDAYWKELPKNLDKITEWSKRVPKKDNEKLFRYLDGEAVTLTPEVKEVATEIKSWLEEWAVRLKLPEDRKISHYITHIFDAELISKEFDEDLAKIIADKIPGQVYDPFLLKRLGAKGYKQDTWAALDAYVKRGTRKAHMDPALDLIKYRAGGSLEMSNIEKSQFNYIKRYLDNINMRPSEAEEGIDNFLKNIIGYKLGQRPVTSILKFFRQATFRGMLGLNPASALRNLSQGINTYATLGERNTAVGYISLFKRGAGEELAREGVLNAGFVQDRALSATKKAVEKVDKALFVFFDLAEKINRGAAYFGAKAKYWRDNTIIRDGKKVIKSGASEEKAIEYAKSIVRKTQFVFDSIDTPVGMSSDIMKTLFQFQTFTTKQIEFLGRMVKAKDFAGLLRYTLAGVAFVYTIGRAFGMEPRELLPWYRFQTPPSLKFPWETFKAIKDEPDKYGNDRSTSKKLSDVGESAIGLFPAGSQIKKTIEGLETVQQYGSFDKAYRLQFKQGESTVEKVQSIMFGKYASTEAKDYFNRAEIKEKEQAPIKKIYDEVQKLKAQDKAEEAQAIVDGLSDADYEIYKEIRTAEKRNATLELKKKMFPIFNKVRQLIKDEKVDEAQAIVDALTDEEYRVYLLIKKDSGYN